MRTLACLALAALALAACDSADESATDEVALGGTYSGVTEDRGASQIVLTVEIPEVPSGVAFRFTGSLVDRGGFDEAIIASLVGIGTYDHPTLVLTIEGEPMTGTVSDDGETIRLETEPGDFATLTRE